MFFISTGEVNVITARVKVFALSIEPEEVKRSHEK
jgi:hypothetical protein